MFQKDHLVWKTNDCDPCEQHWRRDYPSKKCGKGQPTTFVLFQVLSKLIIKYIKTLVKMVDNLNYYLFYEGCDFWLSSLNKCKTSLPSTCQCLQFLEVFFLFCVDFFVLFETYVQKDFCLFCSKSLFMFWCLAYAAWFSRWFS